MRELEWQRETIKVARAHGGFGWKLAAKFLIGVPDLLIKLPNRPAALIEVKWQRVIKAERVRLAVTVPQRNFLAGFEGAGGASFVMSFLTKGTDIGIGMWAMSDKSPVYDPLTDKVVYSALTAEHRWSKLRDRAEAIWQTLEENL